MITNNNQILKEMSLLYNWSKGTLKTYTTALNNYTQYQNSTIQDLINEAEHDEETIHKQSKRNLKQRLIRYRLHLQEERQFSQNTIKMYLAMISKVYRYCDIEVPRLPPIRVVQTETFEDIPTREEIQRVIFHSRTKNKALITFIASTGLRRSDVANLTINDYITATKDYHNNTGNLLDIIKELQTRKLVVPTWIITDEKTRINHITFSSHESSMYINQLLMERLMKEELTPDSLLFGVKADSISKNFRNLNTKLGLGWKEHRRHFHPHALRKFFATTLTSNDMDFLSTEFLLGHSLSQVQSSYYFANPEKLLNKYMRVMDKLTFTMEVSYVDVDSREKRELEELRQFKKESNTRILKLEEMLNMI
ncbi:site-specific integrase [Methanosphaera sp. ISO3-F5]|uniref:tyrosine-type recombinase/integrase n=1 Tax=Methanosphaera sp. ISO3-F5 TaxID=1452353 RepID=UPI002B257AC9|nr:site-specific integrase [Methanosphaera sp. ISO3-F5]WQH64032.1 site-specific integrase [Methanosphaera sp. ISO3-F5]